MDEMTFGHLSRAREPSTSPFLLRIGDSVTLRDERSPHSDLGHLFELQYKTLQQDSKDSEIGCDSLGCGVTKM